jgi:hypothetical protein
VIRKSRSPGSRRWRTETSYAITSLGSDQARPGQLAAWIRGHWKADLARRWHALIPGRYRALGRPFEPGLVCAAASASRDLARGPRKPVLLNGDFHRGNV